eukprot:Opistho-2@72669
MFASSVHAITPPLIPVGNAIALSSIKRHTENNKTLERTPTITNVTIATSAHAITPQLTRGASVGTIAHCPRSRGTLKRNARTHTNNHKRNDRNKRARHHAVAHTGRISGA